MAGARARAAYLAYRAGAEVAGVIPPALGQPLARAASSAWMVVSPTRRRQVARNQERVAAEPLNGAARRRAVGTVFDNYGRYWHEFFRLADEDPAGLEARFDCDGIEHLEAAAALGRGVILALPHLGNWDLAGAWLSHRGYRITVVAEPVEPVELFDWFVAARAHLGLRVVALGPDAGRVVLKDLNEGRVVCLLCDRDLTGDGIPVTFFDEPTRVPGGPAMLALRTGAPLLPVGLYFRPHGRHAARILEPVPTERHGRMRDDVARVTQHLIATFEELIRAAPEQWLMMQPTWPADMNPGTR